MIAHRPALGTCFWELTARCSNQCLHCRVGEDREELDGAELLDIASQLIALGVRRVVLTGGEPILHPAWVEIARRLSAGGVTVRLFTSGHGVDGPLLEAARAAGVTELAVSLDGPERVHDALRPPRDGSGRSSFAEALAAIERGLGTIAGVRVVTQVNGRNARHLDELHRLLAGLGVRQWQLQLCQLTGTAAGRADELLLGPGDLERIVGISRRAAREGTIAAPLHCTVGYGTEEESLRGGRAAWGGCPAGLRALGITARGRVKGCIALPDEFATADVRRRPLADIWHDDECFPYSRGWSPRMLAGACAGCPDGTVCRAGCPAVAYGLTGAIGANPSCLRLLRAAPAQ